MCIGEDVLGRAMGDKALVDLLHGASFRATGVKFTIGEGACAPLTKAVVTLVVDDALKVDGAQVKVALLHALTSLQDDGFKPQPEAAQGGKEPRRPAADDDDAWGALWHAGVVDDGQLFLRQLFIHRDEVAQLLANGAAARVNTLLEQPIPRDGAGGDAQLLRDGFALLLRRVGFLQRKMDVSFSNHEEVGRGW